MCFEEKQRSVTQANSMPKILLVENKQHLLETRKGYRLFDGADGG
jgi:hypothetical protein